MPAAQRTSCSLDSNQKNLIARYMAHHYLVGESKTFTIGGYPLWLGRVSADMGHDIKKWELHEYVASTIPQTMSMFEKPQHQALAEDRFNLIAHLLSERLIMEEFRLSSPGRYQQLLQNAAAKTSGFFLASQIHEFILDKLPKMLGWTFGWAHCGITGSNEASQHKY